MKLSKAQQALYTAVINGAEVVREGFLDSWYIKGRKHINCNTVHALVNSGLVDEIEISGHYYTRLLVLPSVRDYRAPGDYESGDADRITPDAAGDTVTADEPARPVDTLRVAWNAAHIIARLRGYQSDAYRRMQGVFDSMRAYSRLTPQSA